MTSSHEVLPPVSLTVQPVLGVPEVTAGSDLSALLAPSLEGTNLPAVLVVSSKIVSKALGLTAIGRDKDEVITAETMRVVAERATGDRVTRIVEAHAGPVMAAAGVDASNTGASDALLTLPHDADACATDLRRSVLAALGLPPQAHLAVIITDTAGRPWRAGVTDFSLGSAGILPVLDHRGEPDHDGRDMSVTIRCLVDELSSAADLVKGKAAGIPAAIVTGLPHQWFDPYAAGSARVVRTGPSDFFALGHKEAVRASLGVAPGSDEARSIGVAPIAPDALAERAQRAVALALLGIEDGAADVAVPGASDANSPNRVLVTLSAADDFTLGILCSRLQVAAHAEDLRAEANAPSEGRGVVTLVDALVDAG